MQAQSTQTDDANQQAFWSTVEMALVGGDLREVGQDLTDLYAALWAAIVRGVTGEQPGDLLDAIVANTIAVLGPAAEHRADWEEQLRQLREQAAQENQPGLADLAETVLALLAAGGNPTGLGAGLQPPFSQTWQRIVDGLSQ